MDKLRKKTLKTKRGYTYTYYTTPGGESSTSTPALFFVHGFPDSAHLWKNVIANLSDLPNKIVAPDVLGYVGTDKPTDISEYNHKGQANDLADIIAAENIESTIIIGHDWGSVIVQRTYLHHPDLFSAMILLNVHYMPPTHQKFDLDSVNDLTTKAYGYPVYAYWELFGAEDGAQIINANLEKMYEVLHGDAPDWMLKMFCVKGGMKHYLLDNERVPLMEYAQRPEWKDAFMKQFEKDGFDAPLKMYKAAIGNYHAEGDQELLRQSLVIQKPVLFIGCTGDVVCRIDYGDAPKKAGLLPDLEEVIIEAGHWVPMHKPEEVADHIKNFVQKRFPSGAKISSIEQN
ncbi:hypothetical protein B0A52_09061 [Exophiala mesophila]|uniref:AB hydrolase-1 domain-containing protein n=1 Tax=Exophiala mesophila TaxID=212818 RepID=A0A438MTH4_EXOME|nr:hypothetical protein B0A52_09061 [Exophiala mesophila]